MNNNKLYKKLINETISNLLLEVMNLEDVYNKWYNNIDKETFINITSLDPTGNQNKIGKYSKWLLNLYKKGELNLNNSKYIKTLLFTFNKFINKINKKDINQYKNLEELSFALKSFTENPEQATSKSDEIRKLKKEGSEVVYEDDIWKVIVPKTKIAAQYYGKGTEWCTSSNEYGFGDFFNSYNNRGNLYININKQNKSKFQFHFEDSEFMDEKDSPIIDYFSQKGDILCDKLNLSRGLLDFYQDKIEGNLLHEILFYGELLEIINYYNEYNICAIDYDNQVYFLYFDENSHKYEFYEINGYENIYYIEELNEELFTIILNDGSLGVYDFSDETFLIEPDKNIKEIGMNYNEIIVYYRNGNKEVYNIEKDNFFESKNNMKKQVIKLTESDLHNIIKESVKNILKENYPPGAEFDTHAPWNQTESDYENVKIGVDVIIQYPEKFTENEIDNMDSEYFKVLETELFNKYNMDERLKPFDYDKSNNIIKLDFFKENKYYIPYIGVTYFIDVPVEMLSDDYEQDWFYDWENFDINNVKDAFYNTNIPDSLEGLNYFVNDYNKF